MKDRKCPCGKEEKAAASPGHWEGPEWFCCAKCFHKAHPEVEEKNPSPPELK